MPIKYKNRVLGFEVHVLGPDERKLGFIDRVELLNILLYKTL